jgi:hypothetical protein
MCDYSLMSIPNRLAVEGENLIAHRFTTGTMGLASPSDVHRVAVAPQTPTSDVWSRLKHLRDKTPAPAVCVCIPPGARLILHDIPERLQHDLAIGPIEDVTFVQLSATEYVHRDAIRFQNGREVLLQKLSEGQRVRVLDMSATDNFSFEPVRGERTGVFVRVT